MSEMCDQLLRDSELFYILPGKISSDPIEARFGAYRQLSGANFYISCKQLFEAEKKLRTLNLIRSQVSISRLNSAVDSSTSEDGIHDMDLQLMDVTGIDVDDLDEGESATVYYVAGYVGRSIARRNKCDECKEVLIRDEPSSPEDMTQIFDDVNRGGLSSPSELCHAICLLSLLYFKQCQSTDNNLKKLLSQTNQMDVFVDNVLKKLPSCLGVKVFQFRNCLWP